MECLRGSDLVWPDRICTGLPRCRVGWVGEASFHAPHTTASTAPPRPLDHAVAHFEAQR
jgi:hypothetical protein